MKKRTKNKDIVCEIFYVNERNVKAVQKMMKPDEVFVKLAQTFKVIGDLTRSKIIFALYNRELCVCDLATILNISQSAVSHQLRILRNLDLVKYRKEGRIVYYSLNDEHIENLFEEGLRHVEKK
jgi:DNA-binding transcriptional ArsR family regulator